MTIKLRICVPSHGTNPAAFTWSYGSLMGYLAAGQLRSRPTEALEFGQDWHCSSCIQSNRELLVRRAIDRGDTHLLFLDHDMSFDPKAIDLLFSRRHPVVACNYLIKRQPPEEPAFVAVALDGRRIVTNAEKVGLQEVAYTGFGVSLFEVDVFRKTPQPWFYPKFVPESNSYTTEDLPCFERIREAGFTCYVDHDASRLVGHIGDFEWKWDQWKPPAKPDLKLSEKVG